MTENFLEDGLNVAWDLGIKDGVNACIAGAEALLAVVEKNLAACNRLSRRGAEFRAQVEILRGVIDGYNQVLENLGDK
ncbi:hypothetical protein SEA_SQUINT_6 [Mycobacterium phage Squint]|nr:hypothetical protein SEA_SQUINT_6 [Mycobacterium phage Squint]